MLLIKKFNFATLKIAIIILSFILTATILFNSLQVSFTYAYYYLDKSDFIERLCENKDKPEMHCDGKCHLKKVAEKNTENDKEPIKGVTFKEITLFVVEQTKYEFTNSSLKKVQLTRYNNLYAYSISKTFDHPPQV